MRKFQRLLSRSSDEISPSRRLETLRSILTLVSNPEHKQLAVQLEFIPSCAELLTEYITSSSTFKINDQVVQSTLQVLTALVLHYDGLKQFLSTKLLPTVYALLQHSVFQPQVVQLLVHVSNSYEGVSAMINMTEPCCFIPKLVSLLLACSSSSSSGSSSMYLEHLLGVLMHVTKNVVGAQQAVDTQLVLALIQIFPSHVLPSSTSVIQQRWAKICWNLSNQQQGQVEAIERGVLPLLFKLLAHVCTSSSSSNHEDEEEVTRCCSGAFMSFSIHDKAKEEMTACPEYISSMIQYCLHSSNESTKQNAIQTMNHMREYRPGFLRLVQALCNEPSDVLDVYDDHAMPVLNELLHKQVQQSESRAKDSRVCMQLIEALRMYIQKGSGIHQCLHLVHHLEQLVVQTQEGAQMELNNMTKALLDDIAQVRWISDLPVWATYVNGLFMCRSTQNQNQKQNPNRMFISEHRRVNPGHAAEDVFIKGSVGSDTRTNS